MEGDVAERVKAATRMYLYPSLAYTSSLVDCVGAIREKYRDEARKCINRAEMHRDAIVRIAFPIRMDRLNGR